MAVEIKEVIIRAVLEDDEGQEMQNEGQATGKISGGNDFSPEELVEMCVEQVLRILQRKNNR